MQAMPPNVTPVTPECVVQAADMQNVPLAALVAIMQTEYGRLGHKSPNGNGTYDYGPMQVNTIWLPKIRKAGITEANLMNDGCLNVLVGAWILRHELTRTGGNIWKAIGHYHSHTPSLAARYRRRVYRAMKNLRSIKDVLRHANNG